MYMRAGFCRRRPQNLQTENAQAMAENLRLSIQRVAVLCFSHCDERPETKNWEIRTWPLVHRGSELEMQV